MPTDTARSSVTVALTMGMVACLTLAACGGGLVPVHNIHSAPVFAARGQSPSQNGVRDAIMRALLSRGWQVDREGPDGVVATTVSRGSSATVLVQYDVHAYSISYLDSSPSLKFNGASIHRRYNEWIDRLDKSIRKLLADGDYPAQLAPPPMAADLEPEPAPAPPPRAAGPAPAPPPAATGAPEVAPQTRQARTDAPPPPPPAPAPRK